MLARLLNLTTDDFGDQLGSKLSERAASGLALHDLGHLLANSADLGRASICSLLDLVGASLTTKLIPEVIGREIEKATQGIYPLQNVRPPRPSYSIK
jgi:hypothetical protein